jgi:hypothetical protein
LVQRHGWLRVRGWRLKRARHPSRYIWANEQQHDHPDSLQGHDEGRIHFGRGLRVLSSDAVIAKAEAVARMIIDTYFSPNKTFPELRQLMDSHPMDPLREFSEVCRKELIALK